MKNYFSYDWKYDSIDENDSIIALVKEGSFTFTFTLRDGAVFPLVAQLLRTLTILDWVDLSLPLSQWWIDLCISTYYIFFYQN